MFNNAGQRIDVVVALTSGDVHHGDIPCGVTPSLAAALNRESTYIELRRRNKSVMFINKQHVLSVAEPVSFQAPKTPDMRPVGSDDAMRFLGVADTATRAELRDAYHQMVKKYHPDRFESADLPDEVVTYLTDMFQKTSAAYELAVASLGAAKAHDPEHHTVEA